jgi:DNA-binding response OmpR family regulator
MISQPKILLIEQDYRDDAFFVEMLENMGYHVFRSKIWQEVSKILDSQEPELVIANYDDLKTGREGEGTAFYFRKRVS